jgi:hypothetical protein
MKHTCTNCAFLEREPNYVWCRLAYEIAEVGEHYKRVAATNFKIQKITCLSKREKK